MTLTEHAVAQHGSLTCNAPQVVLLKSINSENENRMSTSLLAW